MKNLTREMEIASSFFTVIPRRPIFGEISSLICCPLGRCLAPDYVGMRNSSNVSFATTFLHGPTKVCSDCHAERGAGSRI